MFCIKLDTWLICDLSNNYLYLSCHPCPYIKLWYSYACIFIFLYKTEINKKKLLELQCEALVKVSDWNSFRTNQIHSDSFRNLFPRQSELIPINPKKVFNLVWCSSFKNQSVSIRVNPRFLILTKIQSKSIRLNPRLPIRINPKEVLNPNEPEVRVI